jgi:hypothetical protein
MVIYVYFIFNRNKDCIIIRCIIKWIIVIYRAMYWKTKRFIGLRADVIYMRFPLSSYLLLDQYYLASSNNSSGWPWMVQLNLIWFLFRVTVRTLQFSFPYCKLYLLQMYLNSKFIKCTLCCYIQYMALYITIIHLNMFVLSGIPTIKSNAINSKWSNAGL